MTLNDKLLMNCVLLAGGEITVDDSLYPLTDGKPKALIQFRNGTMVDLVIKALRESKYIQDIAVTGLSHYRANSSSERLVYLPDAGSMIDNVFLGIKHFQKTNSHSDYLAICSADIPAVTGPILDRFISLCQPLDCAVYYGVVKKEVMEDKFPGSGRSYTKLSGLEITGGNFVLIKPDLLHQHKELLSDLVSGRKQAWKMAWTIGFPFLAKLFFNRLTVAALENKARDVIGEPVKTILSPDAEIAMDVDNPNHLSQIKAYFLSMDRQ